MKRGSAFGCCQSSGTLLESSNRTHEPGRCFRPALASSPQPGALTRLPVVKKHELPQTYGAVPAYREEFYARWCQALMSNSSSETYIRDVSRRARPGNAPRRVLDALPSNRNDCASRLFPLIYDEACSPELGGMLPTGWRVGWMTAELAVGPRFCGFCWIVLPLCNKDWRERCPLAWILLDEYLEFNQCVHLFWSSSY
ncbi:uncharacterized protein F5Z01DRAFT_650857 [Emericellopsis atlantica]|uniref:Uncharacterized protein n=1 Tax=Emericellopsis atlantica TaxID=2614577 RepID=A0A9P7ZQW2_9HYPO|nr:uncharacterized protein F5Z01DRAFT_650857 [Emericellopsis atlantica]KAG9256025.1 hypothetical protein F5Z01DRAFT_650857 [Emericellopsis atlantica]